MRERIGENLIEESNQHGVVITEPKRKLLDYLLESNDASLRHEVYLDHYLLFAAKYDREENLHVLRGGKLEYLDDRSRDKVESDLRVAEVKIAVLEMETRRKLLNPSDHSYFNAYHEVNDFIRDIQVDDYRITREVRENDSKALYYEPVSLDARGFTVSNLYEINYLVRDILIAEHEERIK